MCLSLLLIIRSDFVAAALDQTVYNIEAHQVDCLVIQAVKVKTTYTSSNDIAVNAIFECPFYLGAYVD